MRLEFLIKQQHIVRLDRQKVVAGSKNYLRAHFTFSDEWVGIKTAIFKNKEMVLTQIIDDTDTCVVPWEVLVKGNLYVSVFSGNLITSDRAVVEIADSGYEEGKTPQEPSPSLYEQILEKIDNIQGLGDNVIAQKVTEYLENNPPEGVSEAQVADVVENYVTEHIEEFVSVSDDRIYAAVTRYFQEHTSEPTPEPQPDQPPVTSIIDVGVGDGYSYHTIKEAENVVDDGGTIRIHEGTYEEYAIGTSSKAITYEGVDKKACIVQNGLSDKMYSVFDLCGGNKVVKNLTIHQTHSDPQNPETSSVAYKAYSVHCDMPSCANHTYTVENCVLKNRYFACCGIGLWQDSKVIVKDCNLELYDTNRDITGTGSFYCHCNTDGNNVTGQKISLIGNTIKADQSLAIRIDTAKTVGSEMICEFIDNTCSSELYGANNDCVRFGTNDYTSLAETSKGNNIPIMNYMVESADYSEPSGLKDTGYWFVIYDKSKDRYYAGNHTKSIVRAYKTAASQLGIVASANSGKINGWTSTDGQTWTQVITNQPCYNTTITTNVNTDTAGKYAFGSGQYNDELILIDAWSDTEFSWEY